MGPRTAQALGLGPRALPAWPDREREPSNARGRALSPTTASTVRELRVILNELCENLLKRFPQICDQITHHASHRTVVVQLG